MQQELAFDARDEAIDRADGGAAAYAKAIARQRVLDVPTGQHFTTDDLGYVPFREPRAWGAVMMRLARDGEIEATNEYRTSNQESCHARPKRVWVRL